MKPRACGTEQQTSPSSQTRNLTKCLRLFDTQGLYYNMKPEVSKVGKTGMDQINWENALANEMRKRGKTEIIYEYNFELYRMTVNDSGKIIDPIGE